MMFEENIKVRDVGYIHLKSLSVIYIDESPWPLYNVIGVMSVVIGVYFWLHGGQINIIGLVINWFLIKLGVFLFLYSLGMWVRDIIREGTFLRRTSIKLEKSIRLGIILFIISEVLFFFSFFWAYFHVSLSPSVEIGCIWPPKYVGVLHYLDIPLLNTVLLLYSGVTITVSHHKLMEGLFSRGDCFIWLLITIVCAFTFIYFQFLEYLNASFNIALGIYGSVFFLLTGFHGGHVILGSILLIVGVIRFDNWIAVDHVYLLGAIWYYHFVDVVWIGLYLSIYVWGG